MEQQLATTNLLLGVIAAVSALEGLLLIGMGIAGCVAYRRVSAAIGLLRGVEQRQIEPLAAHIHAILDDVQSVTARVRVETERVDHVIHTTLDRVDHTAQRLGDNVRRKTTRLVGFIRGARVVLEGIFNPGYREQARARTETEGQGGHDGERI